MKYLALMSAIALTSAVGFTACSSSDEATADVNPTYDGKSVRTDFAFNITKASQGTTRMTSDKVQEGTFAFRGMDDMFLYAFHANPNGQKADQVYALHSIAQAELSATQSSKVYPLSIPVGTTDFLFYARAKRNSETNFQVGKVNYNNLVASKLDITDNTSTASNEAISFSLCTIEYNKDGNFSTVQNFFKTYLNEIRGAKDTNTKTGETATDTTWASTVTLAATDGRFSALSKLYKGFTEPASGEVRAGSGEAILRIVRDLYTSARKIVDQAKNNVDIPYAVYQIAEDICAKIKRTDNPVFVLTDVSDTVKPDACAWATGITDTYKNFPASFDLPMGAAQLVLSGSDIDYTNTIGYAGDPSANTVTLDNIDYPAELLYFDNSPLWATDLYKTVADYPVTTTNWDIAPGGTGTGVLFTSDWNHATVASTTRAVAMRNNVNYGVSLLQSTVQLTTTALKDNKTNVLGSPTNIDQTINIGTGYTNPDDASTGTSQITLKGILVGGQPGSVDYKMLPTDQSFDHVIYDKTLPTDANNWIISTTTSPSIYTVVFDNYTTATDQKDVLVALELVNNTGYDFYGAHGLIPAGDTFYLVGKLEVSGTHTTATWADDYGTSYRISQGSTKRVFGQDHKAIATFKIGANSLKNAYSTIPDLRSTEVLFGLSVDLEWKSGMSFDVTLGE